MRPPASLTRRVLGVGQMSREEANDLGERLAAVPGVTEAVVVADEGAAYLKLIGLVWTSQLCETYNRYGWALQAQQDSSRHSAYELRADDRLKDSRPDDRRRWADSVLWADSSRVFRGEHPPIVNGEKTNGARHQ